MTLAEAVAIVRELSEDFNRCGSDTLAEALRVLLAEAEKTREALRGLLLSADASWEEQQAGHDWPEAVSVARTLLKAGAALVLALLPALALAQDPAPAPTPAPLAAATYAELSATSTQVTGLGAEAQNYIGGQFLAQAGFGRWAVATRARWEGLPAEYKGGDVQTYRTAEAYLSGHLNLLQIQGVTCGPSVTAGYAVALDKGHPSFSHNMTGQVGIHCAAGGRTVLVQAGSWQPLPGVAGTVAVIWPLGDAISWHGDMGVGARGQYVARISVAVRLRRWGQK